MLIQLVWEPYLSEACDRILKALLFYFLLYFITVIPGFGFSMSYVESLTTHVFVHAFSNSHLCERLCCEGVMCDIYTPPPHTYNPRSLPVHLLATRLNHILHRYLQQHQTWEAIQSSFHPSGNPQTGAMQSSSCQLRTRCDVLGHCLLPIVPATDYCSLQFEPVKQLPQPLGLGQRHQLAPEVVEWLGC